MGIGTKLMGIFGVDTSSALFGGERWVSLGLMLFLVTVAYMRLQEVATGLETTPYLVALGPLIMGSLIATFMSAYVYELQESGTGKVQRVLGGFWLSPEGRAVANRPDSLNRGRNRFGDLSPADLWTRQSRALSHMTSCVGIALLGWGIGGSAALVEIDAFGHGHPPETILASPDDAEDPATRPSLKDKPGAGHLALPPPVAPQDARGVSMVEGIEILNDNPTVLRPGQKVRLAARVNINGEAGRYHALSWESYSQAVATVDDAGLVQAMAVGRTQITARAGSRSETIRIEVHPRAEDLAAVARECDSGGEVEVCFREAYWLELLNQYDDASRRFLKLCGRGHGKSCWHLARLDQRGRGEGATLERAAASFDRACNLGYTRACRQQLDPG